MISHALSIGPIAWRVGPELLPIQGTSISAYVNWQASVINVFMFPILIENYPLH